MKESIINSIQKELQSVANPDRVSCLQKFFKTGPGEYAEGDIFIGVYVPDIRKIAKKYLDISLDDLLFLLSSKIHEERLLAIILLVNKYKIASDTDKKNIYDFYIKHRRYVNNWDLVDLSAGYIVGEFLKDKDRGVLFDFARSPVLWDRRIAIVATQAFIKQDDLQSTFEISKVLLNDPHDLIHKAVGWMLREAGKKNFDELVDFLDTHIGNMPRTMLRYALEKFPSRLRKEFMNR